MPMIDCTRLAARHSCSGLMMGMPPATLPSNIRWAPCRAASASSSAPWRASTSLLAVTTGLPRRSASLISSRAGSTPPMSSTTTSTSGSSTTAHGSLVKRPGGMAASRGLFTSRTATVRSSTGPPARPAMRPPLACKIDATPAPTVPQPRRPTPTGRFTRAFLLHAGNRKSECNYIVQDYSTGKGTRKGTAVRIHPGRAADASNQRGTFPLPTYGVFERLSRLKRGHFARGDFDLLPGLGVAPPPGRPFPHLKRAETDDLHPLAGREGLRHRLEQRVHRLSGRLLRQPAARRDLINQIRLRHLIHPLPRLRNSPSIRGAPAGGRPPRIVTGRVCCPHPAQIMSRIAKKAESRIRAFLRPHAAHSCRPLQKKHSISRRISQDDADEPAAALVDDFRQRLLKLFLGVLGHAVQLALDALPHQLLQRLAQEVRVPDAAGVF